MNLWSSDLCTLTQPQLFSLSKSWVKAEQKLSKSRAKAEQKLSKNWAKADQKLSKSWTKAEQKLSKSWAKAEQKLSKESKESNLSFWLVKIYQFPTLVLILLSAFLCTYYLNFMAWSSQCFKIIYLFKRFVFRILWGRDSSYFVFGHASMAKKIRIRIEFDRSANLGLIHLPLTDGPSVKCVLSKTFLFLIIIKWNLVKL